MLYYIRDIYCWRHFNLSIFMYREIREINVSQKFHVIM